MTMFILNVHVC